STWLFEHQRMDVFEYRAEVRLVALIHRKVIVKLLAALRKVVSEGKHLNLTPRHIAPASTTQPDSVQARHLCCERLARCIPAVVILVHVDGARYLWVPEKISDGFALFLRLPAVSVNDGQIGVVASRVRYADPEYGSADRQPKLGPEPAASEFDQLAHVTLDPGIVSPIKLIGDFDDDVATVVLDQPIGGVSDRLLNCSRIAQDPILPLVKIHQCENHAMLVERALKPQQTPHPCRLQ